MRKQQPYNVWIDTYAKKRRTCPNCKNVLGPDGYFGAYEYIRAKRHLIQQFCHCCFSSLLNQMDQFEITNGRETVFAPRCSIPKWLYRAPKKDYSIKEALLELQEAKKDAIVQQLLQADAPLAVLADRLEELSLLNAAKKFRHFIVGWERNHDAGGPDTPYIRHVWAPTQMDKDLVLN